MDDSPHAFSKTLEQLGIDPTYAKSILGAGMEQISGTSQDSATASGTSQDSATAAAPTVEQLGLYALVPQYTVTNAVTPSTTATVSGSPASSTSSTSSGSSPFQHWYADNAADDAYWSAQPAAVQQLREIENPEQRQALAEQLASQGYTIDNAIMVWGWDAGQTMAMRQAQGYTWVPAANQANVTAVPGLTGAGITPYNPNDPPAGSIQVPPASA